MQTGRGSRSRAAGLAVDRLIARAVGKRLADVGRERRLAARFPLQLNDPAATSELFHEENGAELLTCSQATRRPRERLPPAVVEALDEKHLDRRARGPTQAETRRNDLRVVDDDESIADEIGQLREGAMLDSARASPVDEKPRGIARLDRMLRDELRWKVVVELGSVHPARRVASARMDALALERAKQRIADAAAGRSAPADIEAALVRSREQVEALAATAAELEASIPAHVGSAVRDGLRTEVLPVARHIAEIRGLLNQAIRRLERLEGDLLAERHARVDDLALLVDLVSSGWRGVDARLERLEGATRMPEPADALVEELTRTEPATAHELEHAAAA